MPNRNGQGPQGNGSMSGRGNGNCRGNRHADCRADQNLEVSAADNLCRGPGKCGAGIKQRRNLTESGCQGRGGAQQR